MKKYLLWDFDGTLAYRDGMWSQTLYELLQEHECSHVNIEYIRPYLTQGFPWHTPEIPHKELFDGMQWWEYITQYLSVIVKELGVNKALSIEIAARFREKYLDITKWHLYDDTIPCLQHAADNWYMNIIVSNHVPELEYLVRQLGINEYFSEIYSSANVGYDKPNIHIFRTAVEKLESGCDITMIGDNYTADIEGALNAGFKAILVRKENIHNYPYYSKDLYGIFQIL